jgi:hypothetical protein
VAYDLDSYAFATAQRRIKRRGGLGRFFDAKTAAVLDYLLDWPVLLYVCRDGWLDAHPAPIEKCVSVSSADQEAVLADLVRREIVEIRCEGARRQVRIDMAKLDGVLNGQDQIQGAVA